MLKKSPQEEGSKIGEGYYLLHEYSQKFVIPLLVKTKQTIAIVELTTCGLLSDLLTGKSGASTYFILGITPYTTEMKSKLKIPHNLLSHNGPGTVSAETALNLAEKVRLCSNSKIGLAETGMLPTDFNKRRTRKKAGEVYLAISTKSDSLSVQLDVDSTLPRVQMRQEISWKILTQLELFLKSLELPKP